VSMDTLLDDDSLPISLVAHTVFCRRRAWLESVGEEADSVAITIGTIAHKAVDTPSTRDHGLESRSVPIRHRDLGLVGVCDVIKVGVDGALRIVEYKATPVRRRPEPTEASRIQLALQRLCLADMGHTVAEQGVYFVNHKTYVPVPLGSADYEKAVAFVAETRRAVSAARAPAALIDDRRCTRCSHVAVCMPDERRLKSSRRRISVADPDGEILYLVTPGSRASLSAGRVRVVRGDETLTTVPFERVRGLVVYGNVDLSSALIRELSWRRLTVVWCSSRGRVVGWTRSAESPNGQARYEQRMLDDGVRLQIGRELIASKIATQATQLRRNANVDVSGEVTRLRELSRRAATAASIGELYGLEGDASAVYFRRFETMIGDRGDALIGAWPGRRGRAASDPLNAALNFCYGLLLADVIRAVVACGLDPSVGFVHSARRNKPALALDLMEQFRAPLADSVVVRAINNGELTDRMFARGLGAVRLGDAGRRALLAGYAQRLSTGIRHPIFGYTVTWSRTIEVQTRILLGALDGSNDRYVGMRTR